MDSSSSHDGQQIEKHVNLGGVLGPLGLVETEADTLKKLHECLAPLRENRIQVDSFTVSDVVNLFYLPNQLVKHVRVLTTIPFKDVRDSVLAKAYSLGICPQNHEMITLGHLTEVCRWMKTESGIKDVVEVQRREKLKRRATEKGRTLVEASMIRAMNAQFAEYSEKMKEVMSRRPLVPYRVTQEDEIFAIRDKYWPASTFQLFNIANEQSVLDFCRKEGVKSKLIEYVKGLIGGETEIRRDVGVLRVVLAGMVDGPDVQATCEGEKSNLDGKGCVSKKRKAETALGDVGEDEVSQI